MPADTTSHFTTFDFATLAICFFGYVLLWRWQLSSTTTEFRRIQRLQHLRAPWLLFMAMAVMVFISALFVQGTFIQVCRWFYKDLSLTDNYTRMLASGAMHLGVVLGMVFSRRLMRVLQTAPGSVPPPAKMPEPGKPFNTPQAILGGVGTFCIVIAVLTPVSLLWNWILVKFGVPITDQELVGIFRNQESSSRLAVLIFLAVIVAPASEEMLFRAGLFGYLRTRMPRSVAIFAVSLLFASLHYPFNLPSFPLLFILGVIVSVAYERSGRLLVPFVAHALLNLNTIIAIFSKG